MNHVLTQCTSHSNNATPQCTYVGTYDVVLLDVDSKDPSTGMNCPPREFLQHEFLENVKLLLKQSGQKKSCCFFPIPTSLLSH